MSSDSGRLAPRQLDLVAIPWLTEAEWLLAREYMDDGKSFHRTYATFVAEVQVLERKFRALGKTPVRVPIVKDEFTGWCDARGRRINGQSRAAFAGLRAVEDQHRSGN